MADLSLDQLAYLAAKARLPEKLVLDTARETAERFMTAWDGGRFAADLDPRVIDPINELLRRIDLVKGKRSGNHT